MSVSVAPFNNGMTNSGGDGGVSVAPSSPAIGGPGGGSGGISFVLSNSNGQIVTVTATAISSESILPAPVPTSPSTTAPPLTSTTPQTFATSTSTPTPAANISPTGPAPTATSTSAPSSGGSGVSATTIVAILVPILVVLAVIPIAYIIWLRRRTKRAEKAGAVARDNDDDFSKSESKLTIDNADAAAAPKTTVPLLEKQQNPSFTVSEVKPNNTNLAVAGGAAALGAAAGAKAASGNPYAQPGAQRTQPPAKSGFIPPIFGQQPRRGTNTSNMSHFTGRSSSDVERIPLTSTSRSATPGRPVTPLANSPSSFHTANGNTSDTNVGAPLIPPTTFTSFEGSNRDSWPLPSRTAGTEVQNFARPTVQPAAKTAKPPAPLSAIGAPSKTATPAGQQLPVLQTTQPSPPNFRGVNQPSTSPSTSTSTATNTNTTAPKPLTSTTLAPVASPVSPLSRTSSIAFPSNPPPIPTNLTNPSFLSSDPNPVSRYDLSRHTNRDSDAVSAISMLSGEDKDEFTARRKSADRVSVISALSDDEKRR